MMSNSVFPEIVTPFDRVEDQILGHVYQSFVRSVLRRCIARPSYEDILVERSQRVVYEDFLSSLPIVKKVQWERSSLHGAVLLICKYQSGAEKFFYEMMARWLLPGRRLKIHSFLYSQFRMPEFSDVLYACCELSFVVENEFDWDLITRSFPVLDAEVRIGVLSFYQATRILEMKGLSSSEKTALIQERISSLVQHHPESFDSDVFSQMQHFLVTSREEFKQVHEYEHMSRIVYVFYLFHRSLKLEAERSQEKRHVLLKLSKARLHLAFGVKKVLAVFIGLNFLKNYELFEERHLLKAIRGLLPNAKAIEGSWFVSQSYDGKTQASYLEVEKEDGSSFTLAETFRLRKYLARDLKNNVEKLMPALFMPRNEEEVMKYIITLSQELKYIRDIPQVIISFEEQTDMELTFTVIVLRLLPSDPVSLLDLHKRLHGRYKFIEDRVKIVGVLRKKYQKEATVFRLKLAKLLFTREDHSVDLLKARQEVVKELQRIIGEFRDYNGGMISKQNEMLLSLKHLVKQEGWQNELVLENFFHSIVPVEMRSLVPPPLLKTMFFMFVEMSEKKHAHQDFEYAIEESSSVLSVMIGFWNSACKYKILDLEKKLHLASSQKVAFVATHPEVSYVGYIFFGLTEEKKNIFISGVSEIQEEFCMVGKA